MSTYSAHATGNCRWCNLKREDFCAELAAYLYCPDEEHWKQLRSKCIPTAGDADRRGRHGMTVWQAVCKLSGIMDLDGGQFRDGGYIPTPDEVLLAIVYAETSRGTAQLK